MGGFGSGAHNRTDRRIVEQCARLRIRDLRWLGGIPAECGTDAAEFTKWIGYVGGAVRFTLTRQPTGGVRWWMHCPGCDRRVAKLYRPAGATHWRCRVCWNLGYLSRRLGQREALERQAARVRHPLVIAAAVYGIKVDQRTVPPRPKRMRWTTYVRIMSRADDYADRARALWIAEVKRRVGASSRRRRSRAVRRSDSSA